MSTAPTTGTQPLPAQLSEAKLAANRANAQLSSGPKTPEGKASVRLNAVKSSLTGHTVLLPTDDVAAYEATVARANAVWQPETDQEKSLVQAIADTDWRLARIPSLESGIYAIGQLQFANEFAHIDDSQVRRSLLLAKVFLAFERQLKNLNLQEARLRRQREKDEARLKEMQELRLAPQRRLDAAARAFVTASSKREAFDIAQFGFEFSMQQIAVRAAQFRPDILQRNPGTQDITGDTLPASAAA